MRSNADEAITLKMRERGLPEEVTGDFLRKVRAAYDQPAYIPLSEAFAPGPGRLVGLGNESERFNRLERRGLSSLDRLIVIKLNGGMSATMGGSVPKGILPAKEGLSYLEIVVKQIEAFGERSGPDVPLTLMNSFFTHAATMEVVDRIGFPIMTLIQNQTPRLLRDSFLPLETGSDDDWAPPGHGDLYEALYGSALLERLLNRGYKWAFVSNIDNLAACVEPWIPGLMEEDGIDFLMEVTDPTNADRKGGAPVMRNGRLQLLEIAQVDPAEREAFQDILRFPLFNTNNIWLSLPALSKRLSGGPLDLPIIQNHKVVNQQKVVQIETAMGAALGSFGVSKVLKVGRERFFPTKKISDLFVLGSDACVLDPMRRLKRNLSRPPSLPL